MAQDSNISWTRHTANLWWGCTAVHAGCDNCYAEAWSKRFDGGNTLWGNNASRRIINSVWKDLVKYQKIAEKAGEIHRVFVGSMMDIFEKPMPMIDAKGNVVSHPIMEGKDPLNELGYSTGDLRSFFFAEIENGSYPNLMFLLLTKRPSNINKYIPESWKINPPSNVMFGTSPVNQETADKLIPQLLQVKGKRFLSVEPQLSELSLLPYLSEIDWVIQGGESGPHKRPFNVEWARKLKKECESNQIPYFFKQIDKIQEIPNDLKIQMFPKK
jgi:protein gp37